MRTFTFTYIDLHQPRGAVRLREHELRAEHRPSQRRRAAATVAVNGAVAVAVRGKREHQQRPRNEVGLIYDSQVVVGGYMCVQPEAPKHSRRTLLCTSPCVRT